ncbi:MAG: zinc metallopeptidase [Hyphomicrobiaceae bacterium]
MPFLLLGLLIVLALATLPQMWVKRVLKEHSRERADMPGTGAEVARRILDAKGLHHVKVEETRSGDHYDPDTKTVRLSPDHFGRRSLAAVAVAAHEVGHAMQDAAGYEPLKKRTAAAKGAMSAQRLGGMLMIAGPVLMLMTRNPMVMLADMAVGILILGSNIVMHVLTLPVEFDASFRRALPVLRQDGYLRAEHLPSAKRILKAAAFTYVAAAAMTLLDVARWFRLLRF